MTKQEAQAEAYLIIAACVRTDVGEWYGDECGSKGNTEKVLREILAICDELERKGVAMGGNPSEPAHEIGQPKNT